VLAYDIFSKARTLIDTQDTSYAAGNTSNDAANGLADSRLSAFPRATSCASIDALCLHRKRQSNQTCRQCYRTNIVIAPIFRLFCLRVSFHLVYTVFRYTAKIFLDGLQTSSLRPSSMS